MTVKVKVVLVIPPPLKALTVIGNAPAGCALVICTTPVIGSAVKTPLKSLSVEALILVAPVGGASGVTVVFEPTVTIVVG